jgi:hypothetical protein
MKARFFVLAASAVLLCATMMVLAPAASAGGTCVYGGYSWDDHTDMYWHHGTGCYLSTEGVQCYESWDDHYNYDHNPPTTDYAHECGFWFPGTPHLPVMAT